MTVAMIPLEHTVPTSLRLDVGSSADTIADMIVLNDGFNYHIDEINGANPPIDLTIFFTDIHRFSKLAYKAYYKGSATHFVSLLLYNHVTKSWNTLTTINHGLGMNYRFIDVPNASDYIRRSGVQARFLHNSINGINSHDFYIEYTALVR